MICYPLVDVLSFYPYVTLVLSTHLKDMCQLGSLLPTEWTHTKCSRPPASLRFTLCYFSIAIEHDTFIVSFTIQNCVLPQLYVSLPEGKPPFSHGFPMVLPLNIAIFPWFSYNDRTSQSEKSPPHLWWQKATASPVPAKRRPWVGLAVPGGGLVPGFIDIDIEICLYRCSWLIDAHIHNS